MAKRDYYEVLGVAKNAASDEIKSSYRKLALKYHPDRNQGDKSSEDKFKEATEAYEVLSDSQKRRQYDQFGHEGLRASGFQGFDQTNINDIFRHFSGDSFFEGLFENFFGGRGGSGRRRYVEPGQDLRCDITLTLEEAASGVKKTIELRRNEFCGTCRGSGSRPGTEPTVCVQCGGAGQVAQSTGFFSIRTTCPRCGGRGSMVTNPCKECSGTGQTKVKRSISVKIPGGVADNNRVRIEEEGEPGEPGAPHGDLYCFVHVKEHSFFERINDDLVCEVPITFSTAVLGAKIDVPTLTGTTRMTIPKGTQSGQVFRIRGQGMPSLRGYGQGDILVRVQIETPGRISRRLEKVLKELAEIEETNPAPQRSRFLKKMKKYFGE